jgi:hypothetical protein
MKKALSKVLGLLCLLSLFTSNTGWSQSCGCSYTVAPNQVVVDNSTLNLPAGSTICITGGARDLLIFKNFRSENASQRYVFKNCGGQVVINSTSASYGISFWNCKNFRLTGSGTSGVEYGIHVKGYVNPSNPNGYKQTFGVSCERLSTDLEVDHIKVSKIHFAGFAIKSDPTCTDLSAARPNFTMRNVSIHHNRVDTTATGEGFYIGNSFYSGLKDCPDVKPHAIKGLRVFNNETHNTGAEGIQVGSADEDCQIYNNLVEFYGISPFNGNSTEQGNGMQLGDGTTGSCFNNFIKAVPNVATGGGIKVFGIDNVLYNNIIIDPYEVGVFVDERGGSHTGTGSSYRLYNNTIINSKADGIVLYSELVETNGLKNNIVIIENPTTYKYFSFDSRVHVDSSNNYTLKTSSISNANFQNSGTNDYHLTSSSPARNAGTNSVAAYGVTFDFDSVTRPQQGVFDIGAFEFVGGGSMNLFINAGGTQFTDTDKIWEADQPHPYLDGNYLNYATGSTSAFTIPPKTNPTTAPKQVLGSYRYSNKNATNSNTIKYNIPVPESGAYDIELFFAFKNGDTTLRSGSRRFNIYAENQLVALYDIYDSIGTHGASSYPFTKTVSDGVLELKFVAATGSEAQINAIHVTGPVSGGGRVVPQRPVSAKVDAEPAAHDGSIQIFPNPAFTYLEISGGQNESYTARIIDMQQRTVGSYDFATGPEQSLRLDISQLKSHELYILHVISGSGTQRVFKFVKK